MDRMDKMGEGEILSRVSIYSLHRDDKRLFIHVHEVLDGEGAGTYVALPTLLVSDCDPKFAANGASEREALDKCLDLIKASPFEDIIPSLRRARDLRTT